jgi:hypothetical protein
MSTNRNKDAPATRRYAAVAAGMLCAALASGGALGQTAFGAATSLVFPVVASTATFTGHVTLYNPNGADITVHLDYFDANNTAVPGPKTCADVVIPATQSVQFSLGDKCTLEPGGHFGPLVVSDAAGTNAVLGYSRTENAAGAGFSIEGFPAANFTSAVSHVSGLKTSSVAPGYQTNCFVASLEGAVTYDLTLVDGSTGAQIGNTISGSLNALEEVRYLDVFTAAGAPPGEYANVRADFTRTSPSALKLVGFCTVQDNASFGADFRIAKDVSLAVVQPPLTSNWQGTLNSLGSNQNTWTFLGPVANGIVLVSQATITANGQGAFAVNAGTKSISVGVCYQDQTGPGPLVPMGTATPATATTTPQDVFASGSATVPAGTYNVGLCALNPGTGPVNKNGNTLGLVTVSP